MAEYFIVANSFAAPILSNQSMHYQKGDSPKDALEKFAENYKHPCRLYAANCYTNADAYHKGEEILAQWLSNHVLAIQKLTKDKPGYSYLGGGPGYFEINGKTIKIENPFSGEVI